MVLNELEFESVVLDLVNQYLIADELAEFYCNTLFIETDLNRGHLINDILRDNGYKTIMNYCGNEIAFDFV